MGETGPCSVHQQFFNCCFGVQSAELLHVGETGACSIHQQFFNFCFGLQSAEASAVPSALVGETGPCSIHQQFFNFCFGVQISIITCGRDRTLFNSPAILQLLFLVCSQLRLVRRHQHMWERQDPVLLCSFEVDRVQCEQLLYSQAPVSPQQS